MNTVWHICNYVTLEKRSSIFWQADEGSITLTFQYACLLWTRVVPVRSKPGMWCDFNSLNCRNIKRSNYTDWNVERTGCSSEVRLMKRRKSSPPDDTATDESVSSSLRMAWVMFSRRPRMVSPTEGQAWGHTGTSQPWTALWTRTDSLWSLLRNSSRDRIAATAEATSGSPLICARKYSTSSERKQKQIHFSAWPNEGKQH